MPKDKFLDKTYAEVFNDTDVIEHHSEVWIAVGAGLCFVPPHFPGAIILGSALFSRFFPDTLPAKILFGLIPALAYKASAAVVNPIVGIFSKDKPENAPRISTSVTPLMPHSPSVKFSESNKPEEAVIGLNAYTIIKKMDDFLNTIYDKPELITNNSKFYPIGLGGPANELEKESIKKAVRDFKEKLMEIEKANPNNEQGVVEAIQAYLKEKTPDNMDLEYVKRLAKDELLKHSPKKPVFSSMFNFLKLKRDDKSEKIKSGNPERRNSSSKLQ